MRKFTFFPIVIIVALSCSYSSFAQEGTSTDKRALISEFRKLTGADNVNTSINFSSESVKENLSSVLEDDKEITNAQKDELKTSVAEATARILKVVQDFFGDKAQIGDWSEEVIFKIYDKTFTEGELKELIAFYRTATGQKAAAFLPSLSSQVQKDFGDVIQLKLNNLVQPRIQLEKEQLEQKIREAKAKKTAN